jgi:hypothetical protein
MDPYDPRDFGKKQPKPVKSNSANYTIIASS